MSSFFLGAAVTLTTTVTVAGTPTNAGVMTLTVQAPDGSQTIATGGSLTNPSAGVYTYVYTPILFGHFLARWVATGTGASATESEFDVRAAFTPGLVTVADVKSFLSFPSTDNGASDVKIQTFIDAATNVIEKITGPLVQRSVTRVFSGGTPSIVLPHRNVVSIASVTESWDGGFLYTLTAQPLGASVDDFGYTFDPSINRLTRRTSSGAPQPFWPSEDNVIVTYTVGLATIPGNVLMAAEELIRHWWQWGQQGNRPANGNPLGGQGDETPSSSNGYAVPNRVLELLTRRGSPGIA